MVDATTQRQELRRAVAGMACRDGRQGKGDDVQAAGGEAARWGRRGRIGPAAARLPPGTLALEGDRARTEGNESCSRFLLYGLWRMASGILAVKCRSNKGILISPTVFFCGMS